MTSRDDTDARPVIRDRRRIDPVTGKVREQTEQVADAESAREGGRHVPRHAATTPSGTAAAGQATGAGAAGQRAAAGKTASSAAVAGKAAAQEAAAQEAATREAAAQEAAAREAATRKAAAQEAAAAAARLAERTADLQRVQAEYANYRKRVERDRIAVREQALANVLSELLPVLDNIDRAREHGELSGGFKSVAESLEAVAVKLGLVRYGDPGEPFDPKIHEALMHSLSADVKEPTCVQILQPGYKVADRILRPARVAVAAPGGEQEDGAADDAASQPAEPAEPADGLASENDEPAPRGAETPRDRGT